MDFRVFGTPMEYWRRHMPKGMMLKSDGFASNLSAPGDGFSVGAYCRSKGIPYHDTDIPVSLADFTDYALEFQRRHVPMLEDKQVAMVEREGSAYRLRLDDGEELTAKRVVAAVGVSHYAYTPDTFAALPPERVSHSSAYHELDAFIGKEVAVIGGGASAVGLAALLHEVGAKVLLIAREPSLHFSSAPTGRPPSLWTRLRKPKSGMGPGWKSRLMQDAPQLFRRLPTDLRLRIVRKHLGPSSAYYLKHRVIGVFPQIVGASVERAEALGDRVRLHLRSRDGASSEVETGHVIAATGFRAELRRLSFLDEALRQEIKTIENAPVLSPFFETSARGLYFLGPTAANSFGPMMRFMFGDRYVARRLTRHLARA